MDEVEKQSSQDDIEESASNWENENRGELAEELLVVELVGWVKNDGEDQDVLEDLGSDDDRRIFVQEQFLRVVGDDSWDNSKDDKNSWDWQEFSYLGHEFGFSEEQSSQENNDDDSREKR